MISTEEINEIRSSVDIVDVISSYIPLTPKGKNYFGVCPFHDDHAPSMSASSDKQIYTCFSCGATGNVFKFIMDYEHVSFTEAVNIVSKKAGLNYEFKTNSRPKTNKELYEIYDIATKLYQNNINTKNGAVALNYLRERGISNEAIKEFKIGLATKQNNLVLNILKSKEFSDTNILKSAIVTNGEKGIHDIFYNRIMFPIADASGSVVGFSGRVYNGEDNFKYINTRETEIFKKGEILYNYHLAKDYARKLDQIIIMEGQLDVIRSYSEGVKNVVATMGTAVTKQHALLIKKLASNVVLVFDGDKAGLKATMSCIKELESVNINPKVVTLENNLDPDLYIKEFGVDSFKRVIENAITSIDFKLKYLKQGKNFDSANELGSYVNAVINELKDISDDVVRELTLKKISNDSGLEIDFLRKQLQAQTVVKEKPIIIKKEIKTNGRETKYEKAQKYLLYYMLKGIDVIKMYDRKVNYIPIEKYRFLAREISYFHKEYNTINIADFLSFINENETSTQTVSDLINSNIKETYTEEEIEDYIKMINDYNINMEIDRLMSLMRAEKDPLKKAEISSKILELRVRRNNND